MLDEDIALLRIEEARQTGMRESRIRRDLAQNQRQIKVGLYMRIIQFIITLLFL
jgi:hypothetical protein